jgi:hypothetical protein
MAPRRAGEQVSVATVVEILGPDGTPPFAVRWEDGSMSTIYPASSTRVVPRSNG